MFYRQPVFAHNFTLASLRQVLGNALSTRVQGLRLYLGSDLGPTHPFWLPFSSLGWDPAAPSLTRTGRGVGKSSPDLHSAPPALWRAEAHRRLPNPRFTRGGKDKTSPDPQKARASRQRE